MLDRTYIKHIENSKSLERVSKDIYLAKLNKIKNEIWLNCHSNKKVGKGKCLDYIIKHPEVFIDKLNDYTKKTKGRLGADNLTDHSKDAYTSAIIAIFRHTPGMIQNKSELYNKWRELHREIKEPINKAKQTNEPNKRQQEAYISFNELEKIRDKLDDTDISKLLIGMYTYIPPVRSDYDKLLIINFKEEDKMMNNEDNYMVFDEKNKMYYIVLRKYKTSKTYKNIKIDLPKELIKLIKISLNEKPRDYLFIQKNNQPYDKPNTFNKWANRKLKAVIGKPNFSLTTLRHIYITRDDLKLERQSGTDRNEIAQIMGHSIATQQTYLWHVYEGRNKS